MIVFEKLVMALAIPLAFLNILGGLIAAVWLAILGKWAVLGYGLLALFVGAFAISIALMPGMLLAAPAAVLYNKGNRAASYVFGFLGCAYTQSVLTGWCLLILTFFVREADSKSFVPILFWSYAMATGPIAYMAQKESQAGGGDFAVMSSFFVQVAYVLVLLALLFFRPSLADAAILFGAVMLCGLALQFWLASLMGGFAARRA